MIRQIGKICHGYTGSEFVTLPRHWGMDNYRIINIIPSLFFQ